MGELSKAGKNRLSSQSPPKNEGSTQLVGIRWILLDTENIVITESASPGRVHIILGSPELL